LIETGSSTAYSLSAIQSFIFFFDELQQSRSGQINQTFQLQTEFTTDTIPAGSYYFQIRQRPNFPLPTVQPIVTMDPEGTTKSYLEITKVNQAADGRIMNIPLNMPFGTTGIKQIDFLVSIQKKFNLVMYPSKVKPNEFILETFNNWYKDGEVKNFNKYINLDEKIEVIPANNLAVNELNFGDRLDQDYVSQQFSKAANREFGKAYYTDLENFFSQGKFEVQTVVSSTPLLQITGTGVSGSVEGFNPTTPVIYAGIFGMAITGNPRSVCGGSFDTTDVYSTTGTIDIGSVLYLDQGGTILFTGYRSVYDFGSCTIYSIDASTATVNGFLGTCSDFGLPCI
jgi:hypothetical protein